MSTTHGRTVEINRLVVDQADFFQSDGFTRQAGLTTADVTMQLFFNNSEQPWTFLDGSSILDNQVSSGSVYWSEIPGSGGVYSVRFRPNALGFWRLIISYTAGKQIVAQDYDVVVKADSCQPGIRSTFVKPRTS